ncbi:hypothetical protein V5F53_10435 [Xanthobacter sp. V4C-4]|uniref:hypothetical protein n=1 Tax=Xanthobacter cornucopiae TaxID=3119924 RepID=UPI0037270927
MAANVLRNETALSIRDFEAFCGTYARRGPTPWCGARSMIVAARSPARTLP